MMIIIYIALSILYLAFAGFSVIFCITTKKEEADALPQLHKYVYQHGVFFAIALTIIFWIGFLLIASGTLYKLTEAMKV